MDSASPASDDVVAFLSEALADPAHAWSLGSFGALAEFVRDPGEPFAAFDDGRLGLATARGAIALRPSEDLRPIAYETAFGADWSHAVALALPDDACAMGGRRVLTELGGDAQAARPEDRGAALFDLGLGLTAVDACLRTRDPATLSMLRAQEGRSLLEPGSPWRERLDTLAGHRVFIARIGRIEVLSQGPAGPRSVLAKDLLRAGRTHAATAPIPKGLVPVAACHPAHPCKDRGGRAIPFQPQRHASFQALLDRWGDPDLVSVKRAAEAGLAPDTASRHARNAARVATAQAAYRAAANGLDDDDGAPRR